MKGLQILKSALVGGASVLTLVHPAAAKMYDVPDGDLATALVSYMKQSDVDIIYSDNIVRGRKSRGAKGDYTETAALTQILRGTGLATQTMPMNVIDIVPEQKPAPEQVTSTKSLKVAAAAPAQSGMETVVVTAQHKEENIQQVPIAVTALSQKDLTDRQIAGGPDLLHDVPNMNFTKTNFSGYDIELRGIGTQAISVTTDPAVAVAFNDTPFIRNHFFEQEFYDLQDAEVLLGPQGTLYGRNATAGVVNLKSALPTDTYEAMLSVDFGNYDSRRYEGMLNIPLDSDKLDLRIAGEWTKRDGYTTDTTYNMPVDGRDLWSTRMTIGWNPSSNFHSDLVWEHFSEDDDRLRSGKQLCDTAQPPTSVDGVTVPPPTYNIGALGNAGYLGQQYLSQGCQAGSLYSSSAYGVPYGASLPYVLALQAESLETYGVDPYAETTQSTNLRQIQSQLLPTYRARNDTVEYNATYDLNSALTLTSQTGFNQDFLWSTEDYNRFNTTPGIFMLNTTTGASTVPPEFSPDPTGLHVLSCTGPSGCPAGTPVGIPCMPGQPTPNETACQQALQACDPQLGCSDRLLAEDLDEEHAWQLSQEFRLASKFSGPFNFSVGGNYLHYETEENYYVFSNALTGYSEQIGTSYGGASGADCVFQKGKTSSTIHFTGGFQAPNPIDGGGTPTYSCVYVDPNPIGSLNNEGHNYYLNQNPYTLNSYAAFGEAYYNITNDVKLTAGLRWTDDQKHFVDIPSQLLTQGYGFWVQGIENQSWQRFTGRSVLDWTPELSFTDQTLLYASYSHGYKAGGANPPGAIFLTGYSQDSVGFVDHPLTFKPEYIEAFELGTKNTLLDNTLTLNGDIFYYNYTGYQISEIVDRTAINNNYNAHVEGAEVSANWEPLPGLKFNFAGGWEDTAAAGGDSGIDLMDRTAGMPGWMVVKPFPTEASNCILPDYVVAALLTEQAIWHGDPFIPGAPGNQSEELGGASSACAVAYSAHLDPVTEASYVANPTAGLPITGAPGTIIPSGYPGFNPLNPAYNNGEGFLKNLSGNKLPNAPPFTVSFGSEYTMPVSQDWAATLRADYYWQDDSWARIFNDNPYDKLFGYTNVNVALILTSANGWQVMGYVKNVFNVTAITGDFLNSDDSGLTTNVFLTDPRLYGVRVTKQLDASDGFWGGDDGGASFFTNLFSDTDGGKPPLWIELGGQLEHITGQGATYSPGFLSTWSSASILHEGTTPTEAQQPPLFSAGEEAKLTLDVPDSDWVISASVRYGRSGNKMDVQHQTRNVHHPKYYSGVPATGHPTFTQEKFVDTHVYHAESHSILDFMAGKDVGLGMFGLDGSSVLSGGIRVAQFASHSSVDMRARPDLRFLFAPSSSAPTRFNAGAYFHTYHASETASRKFRGIGPSISWSGSAPVMGDQTASLNVDWGANGAVLFGRQTTSVRHHESANYWTRSAYGPAYPARSGGHTSNKSVTVPNIGGFAGLSYRYNNAKISFGYRTDMFFGAIDGGIDHHHSETLNMSGPFATISFGLGG